jgi:hypothetical protein
VNTLFRIPFEDTYDVEDGPLMGPGTVALQLGTSLLAFWWSALTMAASTMNHLPRRPRGDTAAADSAQRPTELGYREAA